MLAGIVSVIVLAAEGGRVLAQGAPGTGGRPPAPGTPEAGELPFNYDRTFANRFGVHSWPVTYSQQCSGQRQSPVDIRTDRARYRRHPCPRVTYTSKMVPGTLKNTGMFAKFKPDSSARVHVTSVPGYQRDAFRFHDWHAHHGGINPTPVNASSVFSGAEHTVNGQRFDGEVHLVFFNTRYKDLKEASHFTDGIAVIAIFAQVVPDVELVDTRFSTFLEYNCPRISSYRSKVRTELDITMFLARNCGFYTYHGSLTTPLCNESVTWMVLRDPVYTSERAWSHLGAVPSRDGYNEIYGNFRNTMPVNGRVVEANFLPLEPRLPSRQNLNPLRNEDQALPSNFDQRFDRRRFLRDRSREQRPNINPPTQHSLSNIETVREGVRGHSDRLKSPILVRRPDTNVHLSPTIRRINERRPARVTSSRRVSSHVPSTRYADESSSPLLESAKGLYPRRALQPRRQTERMRTQPQQGTRIPSKQILQDSLTTIERQVPLSNLRQTSLAGTSSRASRRMPDADIHAPLQTMRQMPIDNRRPRSSRRRWQKSRRRLTLSGQRSRSRDRVQYGRLPRRQYIPAEMPSHQMYEPVSHPPHEIQRYNVYDQRGNLPEYRGTASQDIRGERSPRVGMKMASELGAFEREGRIRRYP